MFMPAAINVAILHTMSTAVTQNCLYTMSQKTRIPVIFWHNFTRTALMSIILRIMCQSVVFSLDLGPESVCSTGLSLVDNDLFEVSQVAASAEPRHVMLLVYALLHDAPNLIGKLMGLRSGLLGDHNSVT